MISKLQSLSSFAFLLFCLTSCSQQPAGFINAGAPGFAPPSTSDTTSNYIYIDVESKAQLGGIPYYVDGTCKVGVGAYSIYIDPNNHKYIDNRVIFSALKSNSDGWIGLDRKFTGDTRFTATLAVNISKGIPEGFFTGYIELNFPAIHKGGTHTNHVYLGADWNSQISGFVLQAWDTNAPVGQSLMLPNANEIDLQISRAGGFVTFSARPTAYPPGSESGWTDLLTIVDAAQDPDCSIEFGAEGMDPGDVLYFDYFYVGGPTIGGEAETGPMNNLNDAMAVCDTATTQLNEGVSPDLSGASQTLDAAVTDLVNARQSIQTATTEGTLQANTKGTLALSAIERARKAVLKAKKLCDADKAPKKATVLKTVQSARDYCAVAIANLGGVKSTSRKKLPFKEQ